MNNVKSVLKFVGVILAIVGVLGIGLWAQDESYKQNTIELCHKYISVPEEYLDRVPDGCMAQYFKEKS